MIYQGRRALMRVTGFDAPLYYWFRIFLADLSIAGRRYRGSYRGLQVCAVEWQVWDILSGFINYRTKAHGLW